LSCVLVNNTGAHGAEKPIHRTAYPSLWVERAARHLKAELKRANVTHEELAERL
jgi:hypothetical protein